jgi:hypothetical protein
MGSGVSARLNLASGNASGNESEKITIPTESQPWACEIKLHRNHASEADQRDYPNMRIKLPALSGALTRMSAFLSFDVFAFTARLPFGVRQGDYTQIHENMYRGAATLCGESGIEDRGSRIEALNSLSSIFHPLSSIILDPHSPSAPARARTDCCFASRFARRGGNIRAAG